MRSGWWVVAWCVALVGCGSDGDEAALRAGHGSAHETPPPPSSEAPPAPARPSRDVTFTTSDGVTIGATLTPAADPAAPAVILVHQLSSNRGEWSRLVAALHTGSPELTTLAIDLRGHGTSTHGTGGPIDWHAFDAEAWSHARLDVLAAVAFLRSAEAGVQPATIGAIGASIGSTAVVAAAAEEPAITVIVALSPGRSYHGFDGITPVLGLAGRPILAVASAREPESVDAALAYSRVGGVWATIIDPAGHGVAMFDADPQLLGNVVRFLRERLGTPAPSEAPAPSEVSAPSEAPPAPPSAAPASATP
jgi:pimeloyl-ACP methyl ester carboxylesterase